MARTCKRFWLAHPSWLMAVLLLVPGARWCVAAGVEADLVIYNGKILTADNADPKSFRTAQAAAIYDGKFIAVGSDADVMQFAGAGTKKIDLQGRTVIPGLVETHDHLYDYSSHFFPPGAPQFLETDPPVSYTNKDEFLAQIRTLVLRKKPGEWIATATRGGVGGIIPELQRGDVTLAELDKVSPNNPVYLHWNVTVDGLANSKALAPLTARYSQLPGLRLDASGKPTGRLGGVANLTMWYEVVPQIPPEKLAPYYKMEMEEVAAQGLTTFSTRLEPNHLAVYGWLHGQGQMPLRLGYTLESMARSETTEAIAARMVGLQGGSGNGMWGTGDDQLWIIGVTPDSIDSTSGVAGSCVRKEYPREVPDFPLWRFQFFGPHGVCRLVDPEYHDADVVRMAAKYGYRISGMHVSGDLALDQFLNEVEEAEKQYPDVAGRRWAVDHCQVVREEQVERAAKLGVSFSCAPKYLYSGDKGAVGAIKVLYGEDVAGNSVVPFRSMIDNHVRGVIHLDQHAFHPFLALQIVINRKDINGKVWGPKQAISRQEALYSYTRWSSEYLLRESRLGSIEPKKLADFVVLNRDYMTVPEDEIGRLDPELTVVGGEIVYSNPEFAASHGLPTVGYQGSRDRWLRGTPEDKRAAGGAD
jgi:predicted amidohydrolase YtcJ